MAVAKLKCKCGCKKFQLRERVIKTPFGNFYNKEHAEVFAINKYKKDKERKLTKLQVETRKKHAKQKREFYQSDLRTRKEAAKKACHTYIRYRDRNKNCICCNRPLGNKFDAGHFWESGNFSFIRFHEDNIHGQNVYCNQYKGGDSGFYRQNLIEKIGKERVKWLDENRNRSVKYTPEDYLFIERWYKLKLKELKEKGSN